jgi:hypothetical protein
MLKKAFGSKNKKKERGRGLTMMLPKGIRGRV